MAKKPRISNEELAKFSDDRFICTVLDEMRTCHKTRNYSSLEGLIEEAQMYGQRMEDGLYNTKELARKSFHYIFDEDNKATKEELKKGYTKRFGFKIPKKSKKKGG